MRRLLLAPLLLFVAGALCADEVRLRNGKTLEGVIVAESDDAIEVRIPGGTISIPRANVREIVATDSSYADYQRRAAELRASRAGARDWMELARWASGQEMDTAVREAALEAATLEPELEGLAPMMRSLGYEIDADSGRWLPFEEAMRSRGLVEVDGNWMTPAEAAEIHRRNEEAARALRRELEVERLERAAAEMREAAAEMELQRANGYDPWYVDPGWGISYVPYLWPVGVQPPHHPPIAGDRPRPEPHVRDAPDRTRTPPSGGSTRMGVKTPPGGAKSSSSSPKPRPQ